MVKGIINAFDHMKFCFVINLIKDGNWAITRPSIFATGYVSFATTFSYQVAPAKKLISNTVSCPYMVINLENCPPQNQFTHGHETLYVALLKI